MDNLPNELLSRICAYVSDTSTLKAIRLTGRHLSAVATPHLFRSVYIFFHPESLGKLLSISKTYLSKHVRTITYLADLFRPLSRKHYTRAYRHHSTSNEWLDEFLDHDKENPFYTRYKTFCEGQSLLIASNDDYSMFVAAFNNLSSLTRLEIVTYDFVRDNNGAQHLPDSIFKQVLVYPRVSRERELIPGDPIVGSRHLTALLHAAASTKTQLEWVTCGGLDEETLRLPDDSLALVKTALKPVRGIRFGFLNNSKHYTKLLRLGKLAELLQSAEGLQSLEIYSYDLCHLKKPEVTLTQLIGTKVWGQLETINLGMLCTHERHLMALLDRHKTTLISLRLEECSLLSGT
ncbi:MAG: hypothetical protein M1830_000659 [Pleopsidium flavum]|nr:MAG: hypothetical protein M1830_000659 [Pleopsidium flavum]